MSAVATAPATRGARGWRRARPRRRPGLARLHPLAGLAYVLVLAFAGLALNNFLQLALLLALVFVALLVAGRLRAALPYLKMALYVAAFLALLNPLFSGGGLDVLWQANLPLVHVRVTIQGLYYGLGTALRLATVISAFALYSVVLDADDQLSLLSRFSFRSGLVVSLATRLFPVLTRDGERIAEAQRSRGVELDAGGRRQRAAARLPLLAALTTQSLERAMDIAEAMEARGYGRPQRTRWSKRPLTRPRDRLTLAFAVLAALLLGVGLVLHLFAYTYYPLLDDPWPGLTAWWWLILVGALVAPLLLTEARA